MFKAAKLGDAKEQPTSILGELFIEFMLAFGLAILIDDRRRAM